VEEGQSGLLFESGKPEDLAQKIQRLAEDPAGAVRMGLRGRSLSETKYGPEQGYSNLMNIFSQVQATA
jgi:glycosyltransferase involved in cell wall biosynthesis